MQGSHGPGSDGDADEAASSREASPPGEGDDVQAAAYRRVLELERENERLEALLDVLDHDLRNHLAVAKGRLDLARREGDDDEDLEAVARAHERMEELLDDLLDSEAEGFVVGETGPVSLESCARRAWEAVDPHRAELVVESAPAIVADRTRLVQLLENLFRNSLEHGREDGSHLTVTVGARADGSGFYVEDDGHGLPETRRGRLFEAGFSTSTGGTGLGLAIVRDVVVGHSWTVEATESADGGARFEFTGVEQPARPAAERPAE